MNMDLTILNLLWKSFKLGKVSFLYKNSLPEDAWKKVEDIIKQHGGKITNSSNWYDSDPGERDIYPDIKFEIS